MTRLKMISLITLVLFISRSWAGESGMLEPEEGYVGSVLGIEVLDVSQPKEALGQRITLGMDAPIEEISNVQVLDEHNKPITQTKRFEIYKNAEGSPDGLILYLGKKRNKPFKINYEMQPDSESTGGGE